MELHQLQVFVIVSEEENVTRAARRLFSTPSSISMTIKSLEDELGVQLFQRTSRGMQITERGRLLYEKAQKTLRSAQELANYATEIQESLIGQVTIGLNSQASFLRVSKWVSAIRQTCAGIDLQIISSHTGKNLARVKSGEMELGFVFGEVTDPQITRYPLANVEVAVAAPVAWQSQIENATWSDLSQLPWIGTELDCPFQRLTNVIFEEHNLNYQPNIQTDDDATRIALVKAGIGLSLIVANEAREEAENGSIYIWKCEPIYSPLSLICATHRQHEPLIKAVRHAIVSHWETAS